MNRTFVALFIGIVWPLVGQMTHYDIPGGTMRNGQPFDAEARTCAVDATWWNADTDEPYLPSLTVCADKCVDVEVADTGYLAPYGVLVDCSPRVWTEMGIPLSVGRQDVIVWSRNVSATAYTPCSK